jgi:hypothetical protein
MVRSLIFASAVVSVAANELNCADNAVDTILCPLTKQHCCTEVRVLEPSCVSNSTLCPPEDSCTDTCSDHYNDLEYGFQVLNLNLSTALKEATTGSEDVSYDKEHELENAVKKVIEQHFDDSEKALTAAYDEEKRALEDAFTADTEAIAANATLSDAEKEEAKEDVKDAYEEAKKDLEKSYEEDKKQLKETLKLAREALKAYSHTEREVRKCDEEEEKRSGKKHGKGKNADRVKTFCPKVVLCERVLRATCAHQGECPSQSNVCSEHYEELRAALSNLTISLERRMRAFTKEKKEYTGGKALNKIVLAGVEGNDTIAAAQEALDIYEAAAERTCDRGEEKRNKKHKCEEGVCCGDIFKQRCGGPKCYGKKECHCPKNLKHLVKELKSRNVSLADLLTASNLTFSSNETDIVEAIAETVANHTGGNVTAADIEALTSDFVAGVSHAGSIHVGMACVLVTLFAAMW